MKFKKIFILLLLLSFSNSSYANQSVEEVKSTWWEVVHNFLKIVNHSHYPSFRYPKGLNLIYPIADIAGC